jgi:N-acetylgalactosamine kinase
LFINLFFVFFLLGGGMDQAISLLSQKNYATKINFNPLTTKLIQLPNHSIFIVANCLYESSKAIDAKKYFNMRVLECKLSSYLLAKFYSIDIKNTNIKITLSYIQQQSQLTLQQMIDDIKNKNILHIQPYTISEIENILQISISELLSSQPTLLQSVDQDNLYYLYERTLHVYTEAFRVLQFESICTNITQYNNPLHELGKLMNDSHESCDKMYDCSCDSLNELVQICNDSGALVTTI